jgi:hypothetical protein
MSIMFWARAVPDADVIASKAMIRNGILRTAFLRGNVLLGRINPPTYIPQGKVVCHL